MGINHPKLILRKNQNDYSSLAFALKKFLNIDLYHFKNLEKSRCNNCKSIKKNFYLSKCIPDFNFIKNLSNDISKKFYIRSVGKCLDCGLIQDFNRFTKNDLLRYLKQLSNKDHTISEEVWSEFPVPEKYEKFLFNRHFKKRFKRWNKKLMFKGKPKKILFLRPTLGLIMKYFNKYNSKMYFLDISKISEKTIKKKFKNANILKGNIHGYFFGEFLKFKKNFDLIVVNHLIVHSVDFNHSFKVLKKLLKKNGKIILSDEIQIKYHNPFHLNFWDEKQLESICKKHFRKVQIIRDCGNINYSVIGATKFNDNPDFVLSN